MMKNSVLRQLQILLCFFQAANVQLTWTEATLVKYIELKQIRFQPFRKTLPFQSDQVIHLL